MTTKYKIFNGLTQSARNCPPNPTLNHWQPQVMVESKGNGYAWGLGIAIRQTPFGIMYEYGGEV